MEILWSELTSGFPDGHQLAVVIIRLIAAMFFGSVIGFERQRAGKAAGLRTHILVTTGTAVFILACISAGMNTNSDGISRVIQGIITGIGFVGAGSIERYFCIRGWYVPSGWRARGGRDRHAALFSVRLIGQNGGSARSLAPVHFRIRRLG